ncbi:TraB/GumN family protein [Actibacterium pelagium]|uniref:TraB/GumN family protein n=1 Tax=Actibacterium pelagium TaxID=2029103 RepID=UPI0013041D90|nr:TraB/GumN family protein [Actibacterium pelagium]
MIHRPKESPATVKLLPLVFSLITLCSPAFAECPRVTPFDDLPEAHQAKLIQAAAEEPFSEGIFWRVQKGSLTSYVIGTYHLPDSRTAPLVEQVSRILPDVDQLLVEANRDTQSAFETLLATDPSYAFITEGPTLIDRLTPEEWKELSAAAQDRGLPPFVAAKYQPWFLALTLAIPPCAMAQISAKKPGLDRQIEALFADKDLPVTSLDMVDGLLTLLASESLDEQVKDLRKGMELGMLDLDTDLTAGELYFRQQTGLIWEYTLDKVRRTAGDRADEVLVELAEMEQKLLHDRNTAWAPAILEAVSDRPTLVAVGALHLFGETGVLPLLQDAGFTITRLNVAFD